MHTEEGTAPAPSWCRRLGRLIEADALVHPHLPSDQAAFARACPVLREARARLGRQDLAELLDTVATVLNWRGLLRAGPGGDDDLANLEVLLDWLRSLGGEGRSVEAVLALLDEPGDKAPHVHVHRPARHVRCTTIFQAKGLAWDHVMIMKPGGIAGRRASTEPAWIDLAPPGAREPRRVRLDGVRFDPYGGISDFADPLERLAQRLLAHRRGEESARMLYVALTRARRSVTLGLGPVARPRKRGRGEEDDEVDVSNLVREAWLAKDFRAEGVARVEARERPASPPHPTGWADVAPECPEDWGVPVSLHEREERTPSAMGGHLTSAQRQQLAEGVVARVRLVNGLHLGAARLDPPGADPATGLPAAGHRLAHLTSADWGQLVHGWLARWRFDGPVSTAPVQAWLEAEWGAPDEEVADWLGRLCAQLAAVGGPLWRLVTEPKVRLHFELPLIGLGAQHDREVLLSGRTDLLVERAGQRLTIVDFKAGAQVPTGWATLAEEAGLRSYAPQLDAYATAFRRMGYAVDGVALWFVRTGASVLWS